MASSPTPEEAQDQEPSKAQVKKQEKEAARRAELADKPIAEMTDEELRLTGNQRPVVAVNKPTPETPDRQVVDPELPATKVDPDPTGTDEEQKKADALRAQGDEYDYQTQDNQVRNDAPTQSIKAHEGTEQTEPKK